MTRLHIGPLALILTLGCGDSATATGSSASASGASVASSASGAPKPSASASARASAAPKAEKPSTAMLKHLATGRELSKAKKYKDAIAEFDKALAITPDDARVLSEVGWAALLDKDFERSRKASEKALLSTSEPKTRASILYNLGRVAEEDGKKELAAKRYAESLELRDNKEVEKRLVAAGGAPPRACSKGFEDVASLCKCLEGRPEWEFLAGAGKLACKESSEKIDKPRLSLVTLTGTGPTRAEQTLLVGKDPAGYLFLAELGVDFSPGVFGIENSTTFGGIETRKIETRTLVTVTHTQDNRDSNMAGLEFCRDTTKVQTLCILSQKEPSTCPIAIPIEVESSCGPGVELDATETDPVVISMAKSAKDGAFKKFAKVSYTLTDAGELTVRLDEGDKDLLGKSILGTHKLF